MPRKAIPLNPEFTVRQWDVDGFPDYFFGHDKQLYRFDSRGCVRRNKRVLIGTTQGYILKRKFYSLKQLRPLLRRHDASTDYPADF
ncbi:MAG: hypothetical protein EOO39_38520 [Cytophagaceae bacterium]|nr:MAG: hypothetical protein EOO39_38520 [Cytophagaceae bacterium]